MEDIEVRVELSPGAKKALEGAVGLAHKTMELWNSMDYCVGQPFLLEKVVSHYPTRDLLESSSKPEPRVITEWKIAISGSDLIEASEGADPIMFNVKRYISTDGQSYWSQVDDKIALPFREYASLGKLIEEPVPNAYLRSYERITTRSRLFIGTKEIRHFLVKSHGQKGTTAFLEKANGALLQDSK